MRPVEKWTVGYVSPKGTNVRAVYSPHGLANPVLKENLDDFCSYCEGVNFDPEVEHIISQDQARTQNPTLITAWTNFLLTCGRCNGGDNKSNKHVDFSLMYFPHLNNTLLAFEYREGGFVAIHHNLNTQIQRDKATALLDLVGLDKYPDNLKYPVGTNRLHPNDKRWEHRRVAWEYAVQKLEKFENGDISAEYVAEFAYQRGFFSVWFTVFAAHIEVKKALINSFEGTALDCFDENYNPIPRNPTNIEDPL
jgi:hypothetical protein